MRHQPRRLSTLLLLLALLLGACDDGTPSPETTGGADGADVAVEGGDDAEPTPDAAVALPDTPVGDQLRWVLDVLADTPPTDEDVYREHFDETFLTEVPPAQLRQVFTQFQADWTVTSFEGAPNGTEGVATIVEPGGSEFELVGAVEPEAPHRFTGLLFRPPTEAVEPASDFDDLAARLDSAAETAVMLAADVTDGTCTPISAMQAATPVPIGSIFKLYVLGAVADAVAAGDLSWDDTVVVRDERKSLPSGRLQDEPDGTEVTVREAAQAMIEISDNTATDLLIHRVGREAVEQAQADLGHHDPALNVPFVTTRELFQLKWQIGDDERAAYLDADAEGRRAILDDLAPRPLEVDVSDITAPTAVDTLEWFATAEDVCRAHVALAERAEQEAGAPIRDILGANPGVAVDEGAWSYVGFKGGSEPGVLALSWYLEATDGDRYVLVAAAVDPDEPLDELTLVQLIASGIDLLADR